MRYSLPFALLTSAAVMSTSLGQSPDSKDANRSTQAEVRLGDGSLLRMTILQENLEVMTKYGKLSIPMSDIRRVEFGVHLPDAVNNRVVTAIKLLGSDTFRDRDVAAKELETLGTHAYPSLVRASRNPDIEVAQRAFHLMKRIGEKVPAERLRVKEDDVIHTVSFDVVGRIVSPSVRAYSVHFGEVNLKLSDLRMLHIRGGNSEGEVLVDATRHGSDPDAWFDTGITVDASLRLVITSDGQVDLWPQGPGQYVTGPKGYTTAGKGGSYMAGTLLARIGPTGKAFVVGERYEGNPAEEGKLYLHIVPSPWNNASAGNYRVRIHTDLVAISSK